MYRDYLGVTLDNKLSWSSHINNIAAKANRTLNFLKHNICKCSQSVKESAYHALVHPSLEYASVVWDPYHNNKIEQLEKVQRKAARWIVNNLAVTALLQQCCNIFNGQPTITS